jgi:hypothetical protein
VLTVGPTAPDAGALSTSPVVNVYANTCSGGTVQKAFYATGDGDVGQAGLVGFPGYQIFVPLKYVPPSGTTLYLRIQCSKGWYYPSVRINRPTARDNIVTKWV